MNQPFFPRLLRRALALALVALPAVARAQQWTQPTAEELSMTSIAELPGAPAVILYNEHTTDDALHMESFYVRVKVLTEGGLDRANVELPYYSDRAGLNVDSIAGRTIQPDGTIVPFTGKPYDKLIVKGKDFQYKAKVFSLPAAQVGSILEYRYKLHNDDGFFRSPDWFVQGDLFIRKGYYAWWPTDKQLIDSEDGNLTSTVAWTPILPQGSAVKEEHIGGRTLLSLHLDNVVPIPDEAYSPPVRGLSYRVLFYYSPYRTGEEYWQKMGKRWAKRQDKFIGPNGGVRSATGALVAGETTDLGRLKKIYAEVMTLENTDYTREHSTGEDKAQGMKPASSTDDILARKRGSGDQLAELFVAMTRAAGMKAYVMGVPDRSQHLFIPNYLSLGQLDDLIAVVPVEGKDMFFDPGTRYTTFGQLAWRHSMINGLRETEKGAEFAVSAPQGYKENYISRIADLQLDEHGVATGTATLTMRGAEALRWRLEALKGDDTSLNQDLRTAMEGMMPGGMEVRVTDAKGLTDYDQPLKITYSVKGAVGSPAGKRLMVPANLFAANGKARFTQATRKLPVDMKYPSMTQDAVRYKVPSTLVIEAVPPSEKENLANTAAFNTNSTRKDNSITLYRNVTNGQVLYMADEYSALKAYEDKLQAQDQEMVVLSRAEGAPVSSAK